MAFWDGLVTKVATVLVGLNIFEEVYERSEYSAEIEDPQKVYERLILRIVLYINISL